MTLTPFEYEGQSLRTLTIDDEPWFVLADITRVLGISQFRTDRLDDGVISSHPITDSLGRTQQATIVSEAGMYEVVIRSDKPEAATFRRWVTSEVLPAIRRHGVYATPAMAEQMLNDPSVMIAALQALQIERAARAIAEERAELLTPAAAAWDHMASSQGDWSVQQAAGILARDPSITLGRQRLFDFLGSSHWTFRSAGHWMAYSTAIDSGWLAHRAQHHIHPRTGEVVLDPPQIRVTAKGLARLHSVLGGSAPLVPMGMAS